MNATINDPVGRKMMRRAIIASSLFVLLLTLNYFRLELLGIVPGYAPHNFGFNILFFLPTLIVILIISGLVIGGVLGQWKKIARPRNKLIPLLLTVPIVALFFLRLALIFRV